MIIVNEVNICTRMLSGVSSLSLAFWYATAERVVIDFSSWKLKLRKWYEITQKSMKYQTSKG